MYENRLNSFRIIDSEKLKREAEHCRETTDAFQKLINDQPEYKKYYKVVIYAKKREEDLIFEVAGFMDKKIGQSYIDNFLKKHEDWDDSLLGAQLLVYALPPCTSPEDAIGEKIRYLKSLSKQPPK